MSFDLTTEALCQETGLYVCPICPQEGINYLLHLNAGEKFPFCSRHGKVTWIMISKLG